MNFLSYKIKHERNLSREKAAEFYKQWNVVLQTAEDTDWM